MNSGITTSARNLNVLGRITYGNIEFPNCVNVTFEATPVHSQNKASRERLSLKIDVKGMVTSGMFRQVKEGSGHPGASSSSNTESPNGGYYPSSDYEGWDRDLLDLLTKSGQPFTIKNKGTPNIYVYPDEQSARLYAPAENGGNPKTSEHVFIDVSKGPRITKFSAEPTSLRLTSFSWSMECEVVPCQSLSDGQLNSTTKIARAWGKNEVLPASVSVKTELQIEEDLTSTRTVTGTIGLYNINNKAGDDSPQVLTDKYQQWVTKTLIPKPDQFKRNCSFELSEDKLTLRFTITDREIKSDNPYPIGMADLSVRHTLSSGYGKNNGGFQIWRGSFSVSGEVYPGYPKWLIYHVFYQLLLNYLLVRPKDASVLRKLYTYTEPDTNKQTAAIKARNFTIASMFLTDISFDDEVMSRKATISCQYTLNCNWESLFVGSPMLQPFSKAFVFDVDAQWKAWSQWANAHSGMGYIQQLPLEDKNTTVVVDFCGNNLSDYPIQEPVNVPLKKPYTNFQSEVRTGGEMYDNYETTTSSQRYASYIQVESSHQLTTLNPTVSHTLIDEGQTAYSSPSVAKHVDNSHITNLSTDLPGTEDYVQLVGVLRPNSTVARSIGPKQYLLTFTGSSIRIGLEPESPEVIGYGQAFATTTQQSADSGVAQNLSQAENVTLVTNRPIKVGNDKVVRQSLGRGVMLMPDGSLRDREVFAVAWKKSYLLDNVPVDGSIITTGDQESALAKTPNAFRPVPPTPTPTPIPDLNPDIVVA
jgi:hypothetical protein